MSVVPSDVQRGSHVTVVAACAVLAAWSATAMVASLLARSIGTRVEPSLRLVAALALSGVGVLGWDGGCARWERLPGLVVAGVGTGIGNAALGALAVTAVPPDGSALGSGATNAARYLGAGGGVALSLALLATGPTAGAGWRHAVVASATLCGLGAAAVGLCTARGADAPGRARGDRIGGPFRA
ncbi:hypothetical protein [Baekduia alba]|uniref:hypothetical protein n=1 Tax=Baekduia alba TaxID=2997333 RepID=UPI002340CC1E|nr:hypothetical protein [Baekduia alba]